MRETHKIPIEWVDRVFLRLGEIYADRFISSFRTEKEVDFAKTIWQSGLYGLDAEQIKKVLDYCRNGLVKDPPNVIEFYHLAKGLCQPPQRKPPEFKQADKEVARKHLEKIRNIINGKRVKDDPTLPAISEQILGNEAEKVKSHWQDD